MVAARGNFLVEALSENEVATELLEDEPGMPESFRSSSSMVSVPGNSLRFAKFSEFHFECNNNLINARK
uniref:Uncharacterized protein n=1 Tax=Salix viminalis TaxID=40686 RepID=A0A6N2L4W4_SALVM